MTWVGGSCFAIFMVTCWCILMATFPGYSDPKLQEWLESTYNLIYIWCNIIWAAFNTVSTMITIIGIYKILKTMQQLEK
jgi:hypothetical protein